MKKWILGIGGGLVALVLVAVVVLYFNLNRIVRSTVETQSTQSLNLKTDLGGANVSVFGQSLGLSILAIANPEGFSTPHLMTLGNVGVQVSLTDLRGEPVRVKEINLQAPKLVIEQAGGKFNFKSAMDQIPPIESTEPLMLVIDRLIITGGQVVLRPGIPGMDTEINIPLPPIELKNIGTADGAQNGAAVKEVVMQIVTTMTAKASESDKLPEQLRVLLNTDLDQIKARLGQEFNKQLGNITDRVGSEVQKAVGDVLKDVKLPEGLKNLPGGENDPGKAIQKGLDGLFNKKPSTKPSN